MLTQFEYYFIICTGLAFFFQSLLMLGLARRLRRAEGTIRWLKSCRQNDSSRIADLSRIEQQLPEYAEALAVEAVEQQPRVIVYDESTDDWSKTTRPSNQAAKQ